MYNKNDTESEVREDDEFEDFDVEGEPFAGKCSCSRFAQYG